VSTKGFFPSQERRAFPAMYAMLYPGIVETANELGYALALHGSLSRDMDVVAIPWTDTAVDAEVLVGAIKERVAGCQGTGVAALRGPSEKPWGRRAWALMLQGHGYIDLSVMPKAVPRD